MKTQFLWSLLLPLMAVVIHNVKSQDAEASPTLSEISSMVQDLKNVVDLLANQLMMQQLIVEEKARFDGASGIKQIRMDIAGTRPYHTPSHVRDSVAAYHDHANYDRTVGMGEISAVLNGVEFKTRHNDFKLVMPCTSDESYHCIENIPFPPVPPEVTSKTTVEEQIAEMKEWFKAFRDQNSYVRDYRKYFKPVMCYLEGTWTKISPDGKLEESFQSDRHALDATDWADLHQKTRFTSYSGRKSQLENFAFLPVAVMNITDGIPKMAQWNYRILCHPISKDISTSIFRVRDDLGSRLAYQSDFETHSKTRRARFQLNPDNSKFWPDEHLFVRGLTGLLDQIMEEIPGKNNYPAYLEDNIFDEPFYQLEPLENGTEVMLNAARYHRWYQVIKAGASGRKTRHRSYSDANVFMAMTDKDEVVGMTFKKCNQNGRDCKWADQKWSYAIPLEIIYLTPLSLWNPYNLKNWGKDPDKMVVRAEDGTLRTGAQTVEKAYNGVNEYTYYLTPNEFFASQEAGAADTTRKGVGVLDQNGEVKITSSSGIRVFINIPDVGLIRQRYPIYPLTTDGSNIQKEMEAMKDLLMEQSRYIKMYRDPPQGGGTTTVPVEGTDLLLTTSTTTQNPPGEHFHEVVLSPEEQTRFEAGEMFTVTTSEALGHSHSLRLRYDKYCGCYEIMRCDQQPECWDGHMMELFQEV